MIIMIVGSMGSGKTMLATLIAKYYSEKYPNRKIFANYQIKLPNFIYSPYMILPFSELKESLLICDDYYALQNTKGFTQVLVNLSRKNDIDIILTAQRDIMIDKTTRMLSTIILKPLFDKKRNLMIIYKQSGSKMDDYEFFRYIRNPIDKIKGFYETKEIVKICYDNAIIEELKKLKNKEDLQTNINFLYRNKKERQAVLKEFGLD